MLMLHQALPHNHHQHELIDVVEAPEHHHSHAHSYDHDKEENKDSNDHSGFLDFLLGSHAHTYHSNDFEVRNIAKQQIKVKEFSAFTLPLFHTFLFKKESEPDRIIVYQPPGNFDFHLSTPSLRGPPVLG
jgi:hypothetical protein